MAWRCVSLALPSFNEPQSFAEFSIEFTRSVFSFNSSFSTPGLDFTLAGLTATDSDALTHSHSPFTRPELLLGVHVDHTTEPERLAWALNGTMGGMGTPLEGLERAVVLLIVDGVEVLSRNTALWAAIKATIEDTDDLQLLEAQCNEMNLAEKNCIRANSSRNPKAISTSALLYARLENLATWVLVKPRTQGRLHSDLWLLGGFAQSLQPEAVSFLEAELVPRPLAFHTMLERLRDDSRLTGILGAPEVVRTGAFFGMNLLKQSDGFETLYSQILYGPIENLGGYVSQPLVRFVLYNWGKLESPALMEYFKPFRTAHSLSWLDNNLYEFVPGLFLHLKARLGQPEAARFMFKRDVKADWYLPNQLVRWISYRARVVNANLLSYLAVINSTPRCSRRCVGQLWVFIEFYFFHVAFLVKWFSIGAYYVLSSMSVRVFTGEINDSGYKDGLYRAWKYSYLLVLVVVFFMALGRQRERGKRLWAAIIGLNVGQSVFNFTAVLYNVINQNKDDQWSVLVVVGVSVIAALTVSFLLGYWMWKGCFKCFKPGWARELGHYLYGGLLYLVLFPVYTNVLGIYAVCNTSEDCWGLAVTTSSQNRTAVQSVLSVRKNLFLVLFIVLNLIFGVLWEYLDMSDDSTAKKVFLYMYYGMLLVLVLPVCGLQFLFRACKCERTGQDEDGSRLRSPAHYPSDSPEILTN